MNHKASNPITIIFVMLIVVLGSVAIYFMFFQPEYKPGCGDCSDVNVDDQEFDAKWWVVGHFPEITHRKNFGTWGLVYEDVNHNIRSMTFGSLEELDTEIDLIDDMSDNQKVVGNHIIDCIQAGCK